MSRLDRLDFGRLGIVKAAAGCLKASFLALIQSASGGSEVMAGRRGVSSAADCCPCRTLALAAKVRATVPERGSSAGRSLLLDRADVNRGSGIDRRRGDVSFDPQRIDRPGLLGRTAGGHEPARLQDRSFHLFAFFDASSPAFKGLPEKAAVSVRIHR